MVKMIENRAKTDKGANLPWEILREKGRCNLFHGPLAPIPSPLSFQTSSPPPSCPACRPLLGLIPVIWFIFICHLQSCVHQEPTAGSLGSSVIARNWSTFEAVHYVFYKPYLCYCLWPFIGAFDTVLRQRVSTRSLRDLFVQNSKKKFGLHSPNCCMNVSVFHHARLTVGSVRDPANRREPNSSSAAAEHRRFPSVQEFRSIVNPWQQRHTYKKE
ncbi:hypothetical protein TNCV_1510751 [Trichonephila clavipes]|nr:hypothetical protein TNCV_1510751 [Trichonephila clavipes]